MNRSARLRAAAALVKSVIVELDISKTACECCERSTYNHYGNSKLFERLDPLVKKLESIADMDDRGCYDHEEKQEPRSVKQTSVLPRTANPLAPERG